jgi:hypothetical protein
VRVSLSWNLYKPFPLLVVNMCPKMEWGWINWILGCFIIFFPCLQWICKKIIYAIYIGGKFIMQSPSSWIYEEKIMKLHTSKFWPPVYKPKGVRLRFYLTRMTNKPIFAIWRYFNNEPIFQIMLRSCLLQNGNQTCTYIHFNILLAVCFHCDGNNVIGARKLIGISNLNHIGRDKMRAISDFQIHSFFLCANNFGF